MQQNMSNYRQIIFTKISIIIAIMCSSIFAVTSYAQDTLSGNYTTLNLKSGTYVINTNICTAMLNGYSHEVGSLINNKAKIIKTENGYTIISTVKDKNQYCDNVILISKHVRL